MLCLLLELLELPELLRKVDPVLCLLLELLASLRTVELVLCLLVLLGRLYVVPA